MRTERRSAVSRYAALAALLVGFAVSAQDDEERELEAVRRAITALEQRLEQQTAERSEAAEALKRIELELAAGRKALERIEADTDRARRDAEAGAAEPGKPGGLRPHERLLRLLQSLARRAHPRRRCRARRARAARGRGRPARRRARRARPGPRRRARSARPGTRRAERGDRRARRG